MSGSTSDRDCMRNWLITTERKQTEYYKGIQIHADSGMHEQAAALVQKYLPAGCSVLDVGAGAGAFSQRMQDAGYAVTALDVDPDKWRPREIPFLKLDIDAGIAGSVQDQFDAACCLEVIEHVENSWNLLREIHAVVRPGGRLILSTPNITSFLSRVLFLRTGQFHQFNDTDLAYGHINPITAFELTHVAARTGWQLLETGPGGYLPVFDLSSIDRKTLALNFLRLLTYPLARGHKRGWCLFFVLEKTP
jgi:2-polyprenyl-3-methyl-5-hydroxy-6-metoxy-1,4-benzoquinol methylase